MKLSISNIAWTVEQDETAYAVMKKYGFQGLEIAPTRIFPDNPYEHLENAVEWSENLKERYGFTVSSMQSIWYGKTENIFGTKEDKKELALYTQKAIDFAAAVGCRNLVFGCPRNRNMPDGRTVEEAVPFFQEIASYAVERGTTIGMEANPPIYNTNFINGTAEAVQLIKEVDSVGFKLNLDVGTMIYNQENIDILKGNVRLINHIHISEPGLKPIAKRPIHGELYKLLKEEGYNGYVSIEMGKNEAISEIEKILDYVRGIFS